MPLPRSVESSPVAARSGAVDALGRDDYRPTTWRIWGIDFDTRLVQLLCISALLLLVAFYNASVGAFSVRREYLRFVLELVIPLAIVVLLWRENPRRYGWQLGDWRVGLPIAVVTTAVMAIVIWVVGRWPDFIGYYQPEAAGRQPAELIIDSGVELLAWEFFCRGWLLWGLGRKYGSDAIWLQMIPFALMHLLKPELEAVSTILGGAFFGILAWRTRSFLYGWLIHWFMVAWVLLVATGQV
jgi:membrane protease YdiL (CAAX protease family)